MSEHPAFDAAEVLALISDPQYNAVRLHLTAKQELEVRFNLNEADAGAPLRDGKHVDVVRSSKRA